MAYWENASDARLARAVERVCFSVDEGPPAPVRVVPDGATDLLVTVDGASAGARAELFGLKTRALLVADPRPVQKIALRLRPGAARSLFGLPAHVATDACLDLAVIDRAGGSALLARLAAASDLESRRRTVERWLLARLAAAPPPSPAAELAAAAAERIVRTRGALRVRALAQGLGVGERRLERAFLEHIGTTPKRFARIARFRATWTALRDPRAPQAEVALALGYADQAHLLREFRALAGAPPSAVFAAPVSDSFNPAA